MIFPHCSDGEEKFRGSLHVYWATTLEYSGHARKMKEWRRIFGSLKDHGRGCPLSLPSVFTT